MKAWHALNWLIVPALSFLGAGAKAHPVAAAAASADLVVLHGKVYTENPQQPWAEALAISGEKILAVGSDSEIAPLAGPSTKTVDAHGQVVLPGFTDCHIHFLEGSLSLGWPDLNGAVTVPDLQKRLKDYAATHPGTGWVFGQGWGYEAFGATALPDKKSLDTIFPERPVYLESFDSHTGWVNSKALALAGVKRETPDPLDGTIVRDPKTGEATGALLEDARHLVKGLVPMPSPVEKVAALEKGLALARQYGLVRLHLAAQTADTFGDFYDLPLYDKLRRDGRLTARVYVSRIVEPPELRPADISALEDGRRNFHDEWISAGAAKIFLDGVIEAHTAAMLEPYSDDPQQSGTLRWEVQKLNQAVSELDRRGFQVFTHAVGDRAVRVALDAYETAAQTNGARDARHRIEHIEIVSPADLPRFAMLGVIASMQPLHAYPEEGVWGRNIGPQRERLAFAWNSLAKVGAHLAFGSDWEVVTLNPWPGVQTAVTREDDQGKPAGGWVPEQRISVEQAIEAYTLGAAYASHREETEGSLEPGKLADLIIVSQNPFEVDPHNLGKTEVRLTMVGGRVVYSQPERPANKPNGGAKSPQ